MHGTSIISPLNKPLLFSPSTQLGRIGSNWTFFANRAWS